MDGRCSRKTEIEKVTKQLKLQLFEKFAVVREGHPGSVLSIFDIVGAIYVGEYIDIGRHGRPDTFIMSKGHAASAQYPFLVRAGVIERDQWDSWGSDGVSCLKVFANFKIEGIDVTSGSLGHGAGIGAGFALADLQDNIDSRHFVVLSEGELYEGSTWEALLLIAHHNLTSLKIIVDVNRNMILGRPEDHIGLESIDNKFKSFGFDVMRISGHQTDDILDGLDFLVKAQDRPRVIIADTIKGHGVSFLEHQASSHYWGGYSDDQIKLMLEELAV